jgi:hypothetical protein
VVIYTRIGRSIVRKVLGLLLGVVCLAQERMDLDKSKICQYYPVKFSDSLYLFDADKQTVNFIDNILKQNELRQNFEIKAANVPNAAAAVKPDGTRFILYAQGFLQTIEEKTQTPWAATSIMAHEIAHHLNGDLVSSGIRPEKELAADRFSGNVLFRMGASLQEAKAAMMAMPDQPATSEYPPKSARIAAIINGWTNAKDTAKSTDSSTSKIDNSEADRLAKERAALEAERLELQKQKLADAKKRKKATDEDATDEGDDSEPVTRPHRPRQQIGRGCYDVYGNRRCSGAGLPMGSVCGCFGIPGFGTVGP